MATGILAEFFPMWKQFQRKILRKIKIHLSPSTFVFEKPTLYKIGLDVQMYLSVFYELLFVVHTWNIWLG
jgi:hypothetical protein